MKPQTEGKEVVKNRIIELKEKLLPLQNEYEREYHLWSSGIKTDKRKNILLEYENGAKGNSLFSLAERIIELENLLLNL